MKCKLENGCSWDRTAIRCCKNCNVKCNRSCHWWACDKNNAEVSKDELHEADR